MMNNLKNKYVMLKYWQLCVLYLIGTCGLLLYVNAQIEMELIEPFTTFRKNIVFYVQLIILLATILLATNIIYRIVSFFLKKINVDVLDSFKKNDNRLLKLWEKNNINPPKTSYVKTKNMIELTIFKNLEINTDLIYKNQEFLQEIFDFPVVEIREDGFNKIIVYFLVKDDIYNYDEFVEQFKAETSKFVFGKSKGQYLFLDTDQQAHSFIVGPTGSGKTTFQRLLLKQLEIMQQKEFAEVILLDGKKVEFFEYEEIFKRHTGEFLQVITDLHTEMTTRYKKMEQARTRNYATIGYKTLFVVIDEYSHIVENFDKKERDEFNRLFGDCARLGRTAGLRLMLTMQRPDAKLLSGEIRQNFEARIVLGAGNDETYRMAFDTADVIKQKKGYGNALIGSELVVFGFPDIPTDTTT